MLAPLRHPSGCDLDPGASQADQTPEFPCFSDLRVCFGLFQHLSPFWNGRLRLLRPTRGVARARHQARHCAGHAQLAQVVQQLCGIPGQMNLRSVVPVVPGVPGDLGPFHFECLSGSVWANPAQDGYDARANNLFRKMRMGPELLDLGV